MQVSLPIFTPGVTQWDLAAVTLLRGSDFRLQFFTTSETASFASLETTVTVSWSELQSLFNSKKVLIQIHNPKAAFLIFSSSNFHFHFQTLEVTPAPF